jgi:L-iditol 2-dehydrogenase
VYLEIYNSKVKAMLTAKLYGPKDIRVEEAPEPPPPAAGEVLLKVKAVGLCGSDLHFYETGKTGYSDSTDPFIMGHEFMGEIIAVGENAKDGHFQPLKPGQRVAVDPESPCYECEMCEQGHPNLCPNHSFYGLYPTDGALQDKMIVNARNCFPMPDSISDGGGTLLETLGIAIHSVDLGKLKVARSVAVLGCGPVGLLTLRLAKLSGADPIYAFDCFPWRVEKAKAWGATEAWTLDEGDPVEAVMQHTNGRGVDVVFEAAWANQSVQQAADMARCGGRVVLIGISVADKLELSHSVARRKGLDLRLVRRMKHTYPRAIQLATAEPAVLDLDDLISHHFPLSEVPQAIAKNFAYEEGVHKIIIDV